MLLRAAILFAVLFAPSAVPPRHFDLDDIDVQVYAAVLEHTIRPEAMRLSRGIPQDSRLPIFDRTISACSLDRQYPPEMGCISQRHVTYFDNPAAHADSRSFREMLSPSAREELAMALRQNNSTNYAIPKGRLRRVLLLSPGEDDVTAQERGRIAGVVALSRPAYSADGHALVYASYRCSQKCGYGWFVLLERRGSSWNVVGDEILWVD